MLEIVAELINETDRVEVTYSVSRWGRQTNISTKKFLYLVQCCADVGLMSVHRAGDDMLIKIPNLLKYRDNHTRNLQTACKLEQEAPLGNPVEPIAATTPYPAIDKDSAFKKAMDWVDYFVSEKGFQRHEAQTAKTVPMYLDWVERGVTVTDLELAMVGAHQFFRKPKAENPTGYRKFVESVLAEKHKSRTHFKQNRKSHLYLSGIDYTVGVNADGSFK